MAWVFQALVLVLTAALWWAARRDLTARAAEGRAPASEDWSRLRVTVEQLMVELERRAVVAEQRIYEAEQRLRAVEERLREALARAEAAPAMPPAPEPPLSSIMPPAPEPAASSPAFSSPPPLTAPLLLPSDDARVPAPQGTAAVRLPVPDSVAASPAAASDTPPAPDFSPPRLAPEDARYLPIHALADAGETDAAAIARQTGLPRGEVELVLSLRARRSA